MTQTQVLPVDPLRPDPAILDRAARMLREGGLVAFPTETVYGLGAVATNPEAVARIFEAKGRPATNPLIVHVARIDQARDLAASWPETADRLADAFWPGPLTLVVPKAAGLPNLVTAGGPNVGIRIPDHPVAAGLLEVLALPVAAPSANRSTRVSPTLGSHVLKDLEGRVDGILDAGPTHVGIESTVLDLSGPIPRILRPGTITASQLSTILGIEVATPRQVAAASERLASPGQHALHYAPQTPLILLSAEQLRAKPEHLAGRIGLIVPAGLGVAEQGGPTCRVDWPTPEIAAASIYATLHEWDDLGLDRIVAIQPPETDAWRAIADRLWRASRRWAREGSSG